MSPCAGWGCTCKTTRSLGVSEIINQALAVVVFCFQSAKVPAVGCSDGGGSDGFVEVAARARGSGTRRVPAGTGELPTAFGFNVR